NLVLPEVSQYDGGDQGNQDAAQGAACGDQQVEQRGESRRRLRANQLSVADHATDPQRGRVDRELGPQARLIVGEQQVVDGRGGGQQEEPENLAAVPALVVEANDERDEVQRQRENPQEGDRRNLLAQPIGGGQQQRRTASGQRQPQHDVAPAR